jgi:hypothetical protein
MATDQYGAKLPEGVVARLGNPRPSREGDRVSSLAFASDGRTLAAGGEDGSVCLWNITTCQYVHRFGEHPRPVGALAFSPGGDVLVSGSDDGTIVLWDMNPRGERAQIQSPAGLLAFFFVDAVTLLAVCADEMYRAWDLTARKELAHDPTHLGPLDAAAFVPDGHSLITGSWEVTVRLCDVATGRDIRQFQGHRNSVQAVAISSDGNTIVSGGLDETIRFWEMITCKERQQFGGQKEGIFGMCLSADGRLLASGSSDSTILIWDVVGDASAPAPLRSATGLLPSQLDLLWQDLTSNDAPTAYRAIWGVARFAPQTVPFIKKRLTQLVPVDRQRVQALIADLNHEQFGRREKAGQALEKLGALCEPLLRAGLTKPPSTDARRRLEKLVEKAHAPVPSPDTVQVLRIVEALELANTLEARQVLKGLGQQTPGTSIAQQVDAALERLTRRPPVSA